MSNEEKEAYYTTYNYAEDEGGRPVLALLEITDKGIEFIGTLGYEQAIWDKYGGALTILGAVGIFTPIGFIARWFYDRYIGGAW